LKEEAFKRSVFLGLGALGSAANAAFFSAASFSFLIFSSLSLFNFS